MSDFDLSKFEYNRKFYFLIRKFFFQKPISTLSQNYKIQFKTVFKRNYFFLLVLRPNLSLCRNLKITIAPAIRTMAIAS